MNIDAFEVRVVDDREHRKLRPVLPRLIPALETGGIAAMGITLEIATGYGRTQEVKRDIIFDQDIDGSWSLNVYQAGKEEGGGIRFGDEALQGLFREIMELVLDPDRYKSRDAVLIERPIPPAMRGEPTDAA